MTRGANSTLLVSAEGGGCFCALVLSGGYWAKTLEIEQGVLCKEEVRPAVHGTRVEVSIQFT